MFMLARSRPIGIWKGVRISAIVTAGLIAVLVPVCPADDRSSSSDMEQGVGLFIFGMAMLSAALAVPARWALEKVTATRPAYRTVFLALFAVMTIPLLIIFWFESTVK